LNDQWKDTHSTLQTVYFLSELGLCWYGTPARIMADGCQAKLVSAYLIV